MPNTVDILAHYLANAGIKHAWGIPGGEVLAIIEALRNQGIQFNLVKHENAGGFMAEGTAHASGAAGLLIATLGPGVANAVNCIANAQQDRVPLIFLTGCVDERESVTYTHQVFDHQALLSPICKASFKLSDGAIEETIGKSLAIAMVEPQGPVHIDIPISVATLPQAPRNVQSQCPARYGALDETSLKQVLTNINRGSRVLALAGLGVLQQHAEAELSDFLTACDIPLITSYKAKGVISEDHPLSLGASGLSPLSESILLPVVRQADVVLLFGYDPIEMRPGWRNPWGATTRVIEFGALPNTHYMHQSSQHYLTDLRSTLNQLRMGVILENNWADGTIESAQAANRAAFSGPAQWGPHSIVRTTRESLPEDAVVTVDTGAHRILLSQMWRCKSPRTLLQSSGLCTMGVAVPIALGYKTARPDRTVVAFTGDAGLEMVLGDLATVRDQAVPIIIIVFVDESLALIELKQRAMDYPNTGVDFAQTDFVAIGEAFGFHSCWIDNTPGLESELTQALKRSRTSLLACRIPRQAYDNAF